MGAKEKPLRKLGSHNNEKKACTSESECLCPQTGRSLLQGASGSDF